MKINRFNKIPELSRGLTINRSVHVRVYIAFTASYKSLRHRLNLPNRASCVCVCVHRRNNRGEVTPYKRIYCLPPAAVSVEITSRLTRRGYTKRATRYPRPKGRVQQRNRGSKGDDFPRKMTKSSNGNGALRETSNDDGFPIVSGKLRCLR